MLLLDSKVTVSVLALAAAPSSKVPLPPICNTPAPVSVPVSASVPLPA